MEVTLETIIINMYMWVNNWINNALTSVLPDNSSMTQILNGVSNGIDFALDLLQKVNFLLPVGLIFTLSMISFMQNIALFALFVGNWTVKKIFDVIP